MNNFIDSVNELLVTDADELVGQTIKAVRRDWCDGLYLLLKSGKVAILKVERGYDDAVDLSLSDSVDTWSDIPNLIQLGAVSAAEHNNWKADREAINKSESEKREREQYEQLKAKFGS